MEINTLDATIFRIRECLITHRYESAKGIIGRLEEMANILDDFEGCEHSSELPVSMLRVPPQVACALDDAGVITIHELFEVPIAILAEIPRQHLTVTTITAARVEAENLIERFDKWKAKREADQCQ